MKYLYSNIFGYYSILVILISCNLINATSLEKLEADIERDYKYFTGYRINSLKVQPCLAVQFVHYLKIQLEHTKCKEIADKIKLIITNGTGVGGISKRIASEDEKKVLFGAIYDSSLYFTDDADSRQDSVLSAHQLTVQLAYINSQELDKKYSGGSRLFNFAEDRTSYNIFITALNNIYKKHTQSIFKNKFDKTHEKILNSPLSIKAVIEPASHIENKDNPFDKIISSPSNLPDLTLYINNFRNFHHSKLEGEFTQASYQLEANLGRSGYSNSTAGTQYRADLTLQKIKATQQLEIEINIYGSALKNAYIDQLAKERRLRELIQQHYQICIQKSPHLLLQYQEECRKKLKDIVDFQIFIEVFKENQLKAINDNFASNRYSAVNRGRYANVYDGEYQAALSKHQFEAQQETTVSSVWESIQLRNNFLLLKISEY